MDESGADVHLLSSLDDIAWLLKHQRKRYLVLSSCFAYLIIYKDHVELFADEEKFTPMIWAEFAKIMLL